MASSLRRLFLPIFISSILLFSHSVNCDQDEDDSLFQSINAYRASLNLTTLIKNDNAECLAEKIADQFNTQPCTNTTGANTVPGTEPQFANYPTLLTKCHLNVSNTRDGVVLPACVPNLQSSLVISNFTRSQYLDYLNDTKYTGVGIGHDDNWIVVVLTTSTPEGSFVPAQNTVDTDDVDDDLDDHDDHDDPKHHDHDDEEDILLKGINAHRATTKVTALIKSENAECFAEEYANRFEDQPCSNTTGSIAVPGLLPRLSSYPELLSKCNLSVSDGIVLPVCAPKSAANLALSSLKSSRYSSSLVDPKFTGIGIDSEDDWKVVVLTAGGIVPASSAPTGSAPANRPNAANTPNPFNKANAADAINSISTASFVPKTSFLHRFLLLLVASIFLRESNPHMT